MHNHIALIGFKHVGKSVVGECLSKRLQIPFIDLDRYVEYLYQQDSGKKYTCREIMKNEGELYFRALESKALSKKIQSAPSVIALGGGAALCPENRIQIQNCAIIHITADKETIFQRILNTGHPAFINSKDDARQSLNQIWKIRIPLYTECSDFQITNNESVSDAVNQIIEILNIEPHPHAHSP